MSHKLAIKVILPGQTHHPECLCVYRSDRTGLLEAMKGIQIEDQIV